MKGLIRLLVIAATVSLMIATALTGFVEIAPGEAMVVLRLGKAIEPAWSAGPHFGWPLGLERRSRIRLDLVRTLSFGRAVEDYGEGGPGTGEFLTGDHNLVLVRGSVRFRVSDPTSFVLSSPRDMKSSLSDHTDRLRVWTESLVSEALAKHSIDAVLGAGRSEISAEVTRRLDTLVHRLGLGIEVLAVSLSEARPPTEVQKEFDAAQSARSHRDQRINAAEAQAGVLVIQAQSESQARVQREKSQANRTVRIANAAAARFLALAQQASPAEARHQLQQRLYTETIEQILRQAHRTLILAPEEPFDLSLIDNSSAAPPPRGNQSDQSPQSGRDQEAASPPLSPSSP